jgi:hypothetical protein
MHFTEFELDKIGENKDIVRCMIKTCRNHIIPYGEGENYSDTLDEFFGIDYFKRHDYFNETTVNFQIEQKITDLLNYAKTKEVFYPEIYQSTVIPSCRRLETLFENKDLILVTDEQCLEMFNHYQLYFQYLLKIYLHLPISDDVIKKTFYAILSICKTDYSHLYNTYNPFQTEFIKDITVKGGRLRHHLFEIASNWHRSNKPAGYIYINSKVTEFLYLLSDEELLIVKLEHLEQVRETYNVYKKDQSHKTRPEVLLLKIAAISSWTNVNPVHLKSKT